MKPIKATHLPLALLLALAGAPGAGRAAEAPRVDSITWLSADPPAAADERPSGGLADRLVGFVANQWPAPRHQIVQANPKRSWQKLLDGEPVCLVSVVRTPEREKQAYFTNTQIGPPLQLIVRREKLAALPRNAAGEVLLARLLADERLRGALVEGRSYGSHIDAQLAQRPAQNRSISFYAANDFGSKMLPMLDIGRADYTIEYAISLNAGRAQPHPQFEELAAVPIQGAEPMQAGVACPRTPWGLEAIRGIDRVLGTPAGAQMLRELNERWASGGDPRQHLGARADAFYKERAKPSQIR
ncbi:TIGR02285 family protein [Roseateles violae]|uniref:TIGR02285 family protein n=1 Tax=Roseateles violae TaxID=3058042 RepID=A0ABT8DNW2_9BURK|nr:TIGR02285 family protein [Pelomonas sp. PFR6]MDN3919688.1 TIGR02285 family protein [Pelomonas sp. PFR6]